MVFENGDSFGWHYKIQLLYLLLVFKMADFWSISTYPILLIHDTMPSINAFGFNIIHSIHYLHKCLPAMRISFALRNHLRNMRNVIIWFHAAVG